jgi:hypothetical protein
MDLVSLSLPKFCTQMRYYVCTLFPFTELCVKHSYMSIFKLHTQVWYNLPKFESFFTSYPKLKLHTQNWNHIPRMENTHPDPGLKLRTQDCNYIPAFQTSYPCAKHVWETDLCSKFRAKASLVEVKKTRTDINPFATEIDGPNSSGTGVYEAADIGLSEIFISAFHECPIQGCQIAYFQTKNPDLGKFWRVF